MKSRKLVANGCVLGWSVFWVFGFLAISGGPVEHAGHTVIATIIAFAGLCLGVWCYLRLVRGAV